MAVRVPQSAPPVAALASEHPSAPLPPVQTVQVRPPSGALAQSAAAAPAPAARARAEVAEQPTVGNAISAKQTHGSKAGASKNLVSDDGQNSPAPMLINSASTVVLNK